MFSKQCLVKIKGCLVKVAGLINITRNKSFDTSDFILHPHKIFAGRMLRIFIPSLPSVLPQSLPSASSPSYYISWWQPVQRSSAFFQTQHTDYLYNRAPSTPLLSTHLTAGKRAMQPLSFSSTHSSTTLHSPMALHSAQTDWSVAPPAPMLAW